MGCFFIFWKLRKRARVYFFNVSFLVKLYCLKVYLFESVFVWKCIFEIVLLEFICPRAHLNLSQTPQTASVWKLPTKCIILQIEHKKLDILLFQGLIFSFFCSIFYFFRVWNLGSKNIVCVKELKNISYGCTGYLLKLLSHLGMEE